MRAHISVNLYYFKLRELGINPCIKVKYLIIGVDLTKSTDRPSRSLESVENSTIMELCLDLADFFLIINFYNRN